MTKYKIPDMTCGHCAGVVSKTVKALDSAADVQINVESREVSIKSTASDQDIGVALAAAGYPAQLR